nr:hypothetical protein Iba_chr13cCG14440 [Ipomoea batatas]
MTSDSNFSHLPSYSFNKAATQESTRMRMELEGLESGHKQAFHLRAQEAQDSNFSHLPSYSFNKAVTQESTRMRMELQGLESGHKQAFHLRAQETQGNRKSAGVVFSSISAIDDERRPKFSFLCAQPIRKYSRFIFFRWGL